MWKTVATFAITLGIGVVIGAIGAGADAGIKTFEPGTPIVAADVNANFSALVDALGTKQARVSDTCPPGSAIRAVDVDGGVICEVVTEAPAAPVGAQNVVAGPGIAVTTATDAFEVSLDTSFTDGRYATRTEIKTLLDQNADAHGRIDAASRMIAQRTNEVPAGVIGSLALYADCPAGYVATGGGAFVSGSVPRSEIAWLTTRPNTSIPENPRRWQGEVLWTAAQSVPRDVFVYAVCLRTM